MVAFSDFPEPVRRLPQVGDAFRVDEEAIAGLRPDLVLAWRSGNPAATLARLTSLGYRIVALEPAELADIETHIRLIGRLAGTQPAADAAAAAFGQRLAQLRQQYAASRRLRVFLEISARPYFTVSDRHVLGQGLALCGGDNIFGTLPGLAASVSAESVLDAAPEVIIASDMAGSAAGRPQATLDEWRRWPDLPAVRRGNLFLVNADLLSRPGVRILDGVAQLCELLERARQAAVAGGASAPNIRG